MRENTLEELNEAQRLFERRVEAISSALTYAQEEVLEGNSDKVRSFLNSAILAAECMGYSLKALVADKAYAVDIRGINKGALLAALYNNARPKGMGALHFDKTPMTDEEGQRRYDECYTGDFDYFDYIKGRVLKVDIDGDEADPVLYNRDNGDSAFEEVVATLREKESHVESDT